MAEKSSSSEMTNEFNQAQFQERAKAVLNGNWRKGYTVPSPRLYPFQWNWDAGFVALGLAHFAPERAIQEIRSMFAGQWANGMLPHINFHRRDPDYFPGPDVWRTDGIPGSPEGLATSGITQNPVFGFILERISGLPLGGTPHWNDFLKEIVPKVVAFHRYLYTRRDPGNEGLVYTEHCWEVMDDSPIWDPVLSQIDLSHARDVSRLRKDTHFVARSQRPTHENYRHYIYLVDLYADLHYEDGAIAEKSPFLVQDVLFNSILVRSNLGIIRLAKKIGLNVSDIEVWNAKTVAAIHGKLWSEKAGIFLDFDLRNQRVLPAKTVGGLMPLFAGVCSPAQVSRLTENLRTAFVKSEKWKLCPSTAASEPGFEALKYWRGPIWVNVNWMLWHGLQSQGCAELAERVKRETLELIHNYGMWEYFDARPAVEGGARRGLGADEFSWTAALYLDWMSNSRPFGR